MASWEDPWSWERTLPSPVGRSAEGDSTSLWYTGALPAAWVPTGITYTGAEGVVWGGGDAEPSPLGTHRCHSPLSQPDNLSLSMRLPSSFSTVMEQGAFTAGVHAQPARAGGHTMGAPLHQRAVKNDGGPSSTSSSRPSDGSSWPTKLSSTATSGVHI